MPIDPSIALGVKPVQIESPVNALAQMLQVQGAQQQNQLGQAKLDEYQRSVGRQNRLLGLVQSLPSGTTDDQRISTLRNAGYFDEADKLETGFLNRQKIGADASKANAGARKDEQDTHMKQAEAVGQALGAMRGMPGVTPQYVASTIQHLGDIGVIPKEHVASSLAQIPRDPAQLSAWLAQKQQETMSTLDQLKYTTPDANTVAANATSRANNAATNATTQRGQNMTDARTREQLAQGKVPAGYRANADGTLVAIPGGPADQSNKAPTEFQGKSAAFGARAQQADKILGELEGQYSPAGINAKNSLSDVWLVGGALGTAANNKLSDASQRADQAQRDFINAVLRQESGAAIGAGEFDNAKKQYFPQTGDSAAVLQQKAANRKLAVQGLLNNAGHAAFLPQGTPAPMAPARTPGVLPAAKPSLTDIFGH